MCSGCLNVKVLILPQNLCKAVAHERELTVVKSQRSFGKGCLELSTHPVKLSNSRSQPPAALDPAARPI